MTDQQHTPPSIPDEQVKKWREQYQTSYLDLDYFEFIRLKAAQWGWQQRDATVPQELQKAADQELDACCAVIKETWVYSDWANVLRNVRRPKPPSQTEEALGLLNEGPVSDLLDHEVAIIRRALERLQELEGQVEAQVNG